MKLINVGRFYPILGGIFFYSKETGDPVVSFDIGDVLDSLTDKPKPDPLPHGMTIQIAG